MVNAAVIMTDRLGKMIQLFDDYLHLERHTFEVMGGESKLTSQDSKGKITTYFVIANTYQLKNQRQVKTSVLAATSDG